MRTKLFLILAVIIGIGMCRAVFAADGRLLLSATPSNGGILVSVRVEPSEPINAIEATLRFDPAVLEVVSVNDAGSPITLWIERPTVSAAGVLSFAGAIPGGIGISGTPQATLFSVLFRVRKTTTTNLSLGEVKAYLNQPDAQSAILTTTPLRVSVSSREIDTESLTRDDGVPPQSFTPTVFKSASADGVRRFVAFSTTDKESGIAMYEVRERRFGFGGAWRQSNSPLLLVDQWGLSAVEVRATDNAGNVRVARVIPLALWIVWVVTLAIIIGIGVYVFRMWKLRTLS